MPDDEKRASEHREVGKAFKRRATDLERVEMLTVALGAFVRPIPNYEPRLPPRILQLLQRVKS